MPADWQITPHGLIPRDAWFGDDLDGHSSIYYAERWPDGRAPACVELSPAPWCKTGVSDCPGWRAFVTLWVPDLPAFTGDAWNGRLWSGSTSGSSPLLVAWAEGVAMARDLERERDVILDGILSLARGFDELIAA